MIRQSIAIALLALCLGSLSWPACADDYVPPTGPNLLRALVRFKALDLSVDPLIDEYAEVTDCDLFKAYYSDDFKWNAVRTAIRQSVRQNIAGFPTSFGYVAELNLDRYDFKQKTYLFSRDNPVTNVNVFRLFEFTEPPCQGREIKFLPKAYRAVLDTPITMAGVPITQKDGEAMLQRMEADGNTARRIYARFNLTITYIEPLRGAGDFNNMNERYTQFRVNDISSVHMDARLDSIDFFEDKALTRLIYEAKM